MEVSFSAQAFKDVVAAEVWWRANRDSKNLFSDEVRAALVLLETAPRLGQRIKGRSAKAETRRLVLKRSRFLMFYEIEAERVVVLRLWHPARRPGGALSR